MITVLVENLLESTGATIAVANAASSAPATRLYDRNRGLQMHVASSGVLRIDYDGGSGVQSPASRLAILGHTYVSTAVILYRSSAAAAATSTQFTEVARWDIRGIDPFLSSSFTASSDVRSWRVEFSSNTSTATSTSFSPHVKLGEVLLGSPQVIGTNPSLRRGPERVSGNVIVAESPSRYPWTYRRSEPLVMFDWSWRLFPSTDYTSLASAFEISGEGSKAMVVVDPRSVTRWMRFRSPDLDRMPVLDALDGNGTYEVRSEVVEVP